VARIVACADLFFGAKIKETLVSAGHDVELVARPEDLSGTGLPPGAVLIIDLDSPAAVEALGIVGEGRTLGYYSHVDTDTRRRAEEAGFDLVVPRSRMAREMPELVARLVGSAG
jgi:hypothetical protein